jgi:hypothetical protein
MLTLPPVKRKLFVERLEVAAAPAELEKAVRTGVVKDELAYLKALVEAGKLALGAARPFTRAGLTRSSVLEWHVRFESPLG